MKTERATRDGEGFTRMELVVVICVLAVVVVVLLPGLVPQHHDLPRRSLINCVNNLKQIGLGFRIWAGDNGDKFPMQLSVTNGGAMELAVAGNVSAIFCVMSNELASPKVLVCPEDTSRHFAANFTTDLNHQTISYFVALDAEDNYPQMILSGDDNLEVNSVRVRPGILNLRTNTPFSWTKERHNGAGNIGLLDGSVQTITRAALQTAFRSAQTGIPSTGTATNRLVIP